MSATAFAAPPCGAGLHMLIGQSREGLWIVRDADGLCGAIFAGREAALHYAKSECEAAGSQPSEWRFVGALDLPALFA